MRPFLALFVTLFLVACGSTPATPIPIASPTPAAPLVFHGTGASQTEAFTLASGDYMFQWAASEPQSSGVGCFQSGYFEDTANPNIPILLVGNQMVKGQANGNTNAYSVKAGRYFLNMNTSCTWVVTITRQMK